MTQNAKWTLDRNLSVGLIVAVLFQAGAFIWYGAIAVHLRIYWPAGLVLPNPKPPSFLSLVIAYEGSGQFERP